MKTLRFAWRNLGRNRGRTAISLAAMVASTSILIFSFCMVEGLRHQMLTRTVRLGVGEAEAHAKGYLQDRSIYTSLADPDSLLQAAAASAIAASPRAIGGGLLSSGPRSAGVVLVGVDPAAEALTGDLPTWLKTGRYLTPGQRNQVVLGSRLARSLDATEGSSLVVVVQAADGSIGNEMVTVAGILKPVSDNIDRGTAFLLRSDWNSLFVAQDRVHEIVFSSNGKLETSALVATLAPHAGEATVETWQELLPELATLISFWAVVRWISATIFMVAGGLGVMNTMLMATFERIPEFGLIKALGATPRQIVGDVAAESLVLGLCGVCIGTLLGAVVALWGQNQGLNLAILGGDDVSLGGMMMDPVWKGRVTAANLLQPPGVMLLTSLVAALYPAWKASRLDPVKAMTHV